jgi:hypothetical protein
MRANSLFLVFTAWTAISCGATAKSPRHVPDPHAPSYTVTVWVETDARLPKALMLKGCGLWNVMKVTCRETADKDMADIRVYADDGECVIKTPDDGKTHTTLAWAYSGGDIKMMMRCLTHEGGVYDAAQLGRVMGHEAGHQVGIWDHVPYPPECEDAKTHPSGKKVCGTALMNPYDNPKVDFVTEIDAMAFDLRDPQHSVLLNDAPNKDVPDCVYYGPDRP